MFWLKRKWNFFFLFLMLICSETFAVGFGKITLYSYLNEPLSAEIELLGVENIDQHQLAVNLASPKDFVRAGMARPFYLTRLKFDVIRYEKKTLVHVSTNTAISHPFLDFLVELSWPHGRLVKGYTLLVDPQPPAGKLANRPQPLIKKIKPKDNRVNFRGDTPTYGTKAETRAIAKKTVTAKAKEKLELNSEKNNKKLTAKELAKEQQISNAKAEVEEIVTHAGQQDKLESLNKKEPKLNLQEKNKAVVAEEKLFEQEDYLADIERIKSIPVAEETIDFDTLVTDQKQEIGVLGKILETAKSSSKLKDSDEFLEALGADESLKNNSSKLPATNEAVTKDATPLAKEQSKSKTKTAGNVSSPASMPPAEITTDTSTTEESLYKKYGMELLFTLVTVLVVSLVGIKLLRKKEGDEVEEEFYFDEQGNPLDASTEVEQDILSDQELDFAVDIEINEGDESSLAAIAEEIEAMESGTILKERKPNKIESIAEPTIVGVAEKLTASEEKLAQEIDKAIEISPPTEKDIETEAEVKETSSATGLDVELESLEKELEASQANLKATEQVTPSHTEVSFEQVEAEGTSVNLPGNSVTEKTKQTNIQPDNQATTNTEIKQANVGDSNLPTIDIEDELDLALNSLYSELSTEEGTESGSGNLEVTALADSEFEVKINLAKQYIEAGDKESAKEILTDILASENGNYKKQAEELLAKI